ncbi:alpha/beta hydrolase [bacterium]|nr:alpha/beta hydrolase [bacterium]
MENCQSIIILHGWQSSKEKWNKVKELLEKEGIEVIIPDLPGFKQENRLTRPWNLDDYVEWLENFTEEKKEFFLLGHSFGGRISIKFASQFPQKIRGLILVASAGIRHKKSFIFSLLLYLKRFSFLPGYNFFRHIFYKKILKKTDYISAKGHLRETFKNIIEEDLTDFLSRIRIKTLILWGDKDKITPLCDAYLMKEKIPDAELEVLESVGHAPYLECPEILAERIIRFIKKLCL